MWPELSVLVLLGVFGVYAISIGAVPIGILMLYAIIGYYAYPMYRDIVARY